MNPRERLAQIEAELRSIDEAAGESPLTTEQQTSWDALSTERSQVQETIRKDDERRQTVRSLAAKPGHTEDGDGVRGGAPNVSIKKDPFDVLRNGGYGVSRQQLVEANLRAAEHLIGDADGLKQFEQIVRRHVGDTQWAAGILARSHPDYLTAFSKLVTGRGQFLTDDEKRAAMQVGSNTAGGYLVPTHLDPTLILTNSGSSNVIRSISRVVTLTDGANQWNGVSTAGVTASWDAELTEVSDDTPTFARVNIPVFAAKSLVQASIESFEDISGLASDVLMLFADAKDRLEGAAHATGSGSGQPTGIFTALDANTNVELTSTTAAAIGVVDLNAMYTAVPVRWRSRSTWLMNPVYNAAIKALGTTLGSAYSGDLTQAPAGRYLGRPVVESDDAPNTQTTTVRDNEVVLGDFSNFVIVDKPGSMAVEFIPHLFSTTTNLPDGRRGWYMHWRNGSDSVNDLAFRMLQDKTSA
ncbi:phage major capsid protein [Micromonospora arida]|uniref:phage major capsid protein n=1 Tax=Micromonospora arida TaxID=2203715 RepID=UPI0033A17F28